jgi:methyl-accepting chemotaxis protein
MTIVGAICMALVAATVLAKKTDARISQLSQAAARIGDVVDLIQTIAGQTNLLRLQSS